MVAIISLWSIARMDYFELQPLHNYRRNYSRSREILGSVDYTATVSLIVTSIVYFDAHGRLILNLGF